MNQNYEKAVAMLKEKQLIADEQHLCLSEKVGSTAKCLLENQVKNTKKDNLYAR